MRFVEGTSDQAAFLDALVTPFSRIETHDVTHEHVALKFAQLNVHMCVNVLTLPDVRNVFAATLALGRASGCGQLAVPEGRKNS